MASVLLQNTTAAKPWDQHGNAVEVAAGTRLWTCLQTSAPGTTPLQGSAAAGLNLFFSDDSGATWTYHSNLSTTTSMVGSVVTYQDSGSTWHMHVFYGVINATTQPVSHRALHANTNTGTPGALTTAVNVDAGGTNAGAGDPNPWVSNTGTNPRVWVTYKKATSSTAFKSTVQYAATGTAGDTAANWTLLGDLITAAANHAAWSAGAWLTIGGNQRCVVVTTDTNTTQQMRAYVFDPTAATPALGTSNVFGTGSFEGATEGPTFSLAAKNDYIVIGRRTAASAATWTFYKSTTGTSWSNPTGWTSLSMGRCALVSDGTDFYAVYSGAAALAVGTTVDTVSYRKITASSDAMGAQTAFSDTNGNPTACAIIGTNLVGIYRAGIGTPYPIRVDAVSLASAAQTTAAPIVVPNQAVTASGGWW